MSMNKLDDLLVAAVDDDAPWTPPLRSHVDDCGYDLFISEEITLLPGETVKLKHNIRVQLPPNTWAMLIGRSSSTVQGLHVTTAVIDNGYRGPLFAIVTNHTDTPARVEVKDRLAQLVLMPMLTPRVRLVSNRNMTPTRRGNKGYGSTGR